MADYNLQPNESIIIKSDRVSHGNNVLSKYTDDLILTNFNIILISKGLYGKTKSIQTYPVNQIKVFNGQAQTILSRSRNLIPQIEIYFRNGQETFGFMNKSDAVKWIDNINRLLTGNLADEESKKLMAIPGTELVVSTLKDTFDAVKGVFGNGQKSAGKTQNLKVTIRCLACGAPLSGIQGTSIKCKYCDTDQSL